MKSFLARIKDPPDNFFGWLIVTGAIFSIIAAFYGCSMVMEIIIGWVHDYPLQTLATGVALLVGWLIARKWFGVRPLLVIAEKHLKASIGMQGAVFIIYSLPFIVVAGLADLGAADLPRVRLSWALVWAMIVAVYTERGARKEAQRKEYLEAQREEYRKNNPELYEKYARKSPSQTGHSDSVQ
jgi:hypothetical protein